MTQLNELEFWIDLNLPPKLANWLIEGFNMNAKSFKDLAFTDLPDMEVYKTAAKKTI
jgi:predicted nuclease of predicted toxin-antitoxin system